MIFYPHINPIMLSIGPIQLHWYGFMYVLGFFLARQLGRLRAKETFRGWSLEAVDDLIFYAALGVLFGGRIGYVIFYHLSVLLTDPLYLFRLWEGGMSFHGGFIGVTLSLMIYARKTQRAFLDVTDFLVPLAPLGIAAGRIGNFINGELWGRPTDLPWGMVFPQVDHLTRHPSQLYECFGEGLLLFLIVWLFSKKMHHRGAVSGIFCLGYGCIRFLLEFFREPDLQLGFIYSHWLTMGQLLSFPIIIYGLVLLYRSPKLIQQPGDQHATIP